MRALALIAIISVAGCRSEQGRAGHAAELTNEKPSAPPPLPVAPPAKIDDGLRIVYLVQPLTELDRTLAVIRKRIALLPLTAIARREGDRLVVDLAGGSSDAAMVRARDFIATPWNLEISSTTERSAVTNDMIANARSETGVDGTPTIAIELDDSGRQRFAELTKQNVGKQIAVMLDGNVVVQPTVRAAITSGRLVFPAPAGATADDLRELVAALRSGRMSALLISENVSVLRGGVVQPAP